MAVHHPVGANHAPTRKAASPKGAQGATAEQEQDLLIVMIKVLMGGAAGVDGTDNTFYDGGGTRTAVITGTNRLSRTASKTAAAGNGTSSSITTHVV